VTTASKKSGLFSLIIGAIGIVFGDIGTSPLYTVKSVFTNNYMEASEVNVIGLASLIFWLLTLIVSLKYLLLVMRADNKGEGGILALSALVARHSKGATLVSIILGMAGAALLLGDGVITPAISILGALEGLSVLSPLFESYIVPLAVLLTLLLFFLQKKGTRQIGRFFGPVILIWFFTIAILGIPAVIAQPKILLAFNPWYAFKIIESNNWLSLHIIGSVFLAITGVEALYADIGHFNKFSIRLSWFTLAFPCLLLNYFGQCALILSDSQAVSNPFYQLVPQHLLIPTIILATIASVIASQAVITGIFSITHQAILLGYIPRMRIIHTSDYLEGQVYIPLISHLIMFLVIISIAIFQSSGHLASAYGLTINLIMIITSILIIRLARKAWKWNAAKISLVFSLFIVIDLAFLIANLAKFLEGAWYSFLITSVFFTIMYIWRKGKDILEKQSYKTKMRVSKFSEHIVTTVRHRIPGTAVYMTRNAEYVPLSLLTNLECHQCVHEQVIFLSVTVKNVPRVRPSKRVKITYYNNGIYRVQAFYGFTEAPNIVKIIKRLSELGLPLQAAHTSFFLGRGIPIASRLPYLTNWEEKLFIFLFHNSASPTDFFRLPNKRVVEIGTRILV
jgi:KUP system potassium uptake protein